MNYIKFACHLIFRSLSSSIRGASEQSMALTLTWMIMLGMNAVGANSQVLGCDAIISGPINGEGFVFQLYSLNTNETHPAVVRCHVTCLNQQGIYNPAMALIITSQEQFISLRGSNISSGDGLYEIHFRGISVCDAQNNYTMEFEYRIYSNSYIIDLAVLQCGVEHPFTSPPCWGQSYGIIRYDTDLATTSTHSPSTATSGELPLPTSPVHVITALQVQMGLITFITILVIAVALSVSVSVVVGFLYMRLRKRIVTVATTEERPLVIKSVQTKEEKEFPAEQASNPSPTHTKLNQKLPDKITSRVLS